MKILICGTGSIASRHYSNLVKLGFRNIFFFKSTNNKIHKKILVKDEKIIKNFNVLKNNNFDLAFICNETSKHFRISEVLAKNKCHLFIEKPVSNRLCEIKKLIVLEKKYKIKVAIGYMSRFHPFIKKIKKFVNTNLENIYFVRSHWGEFLPDWHPYEDYKKSYVVKKNLGGGVSLTLCHEMDLLNFLFGKILKINKLKTTNQNLKIETDNVADYQIQFKERIIANIHLNLLQKPKQRTLEIYSSKKNFILDFNSHKLKTIDASGKQKIEKLKNYNRNNMFIEEIKFFLKYLRDKKKYQEIPTLQQSLYIQKFI
jgi:predicted dehydrogenase